MRTQRLFFSIVFTILLLFSQQASYVHALSHINESEEFSDKSFPAYKICAKCVGFAHLDTFTHVASLTLDISQVSGFITSVYAVHSYFSSLFFYQSRAPPSIF